jgi:hypothetical protein
MRSYLIILIAATLTGCLSAAELTGTHAPPFEKASNTVPSVEEAAQYLVGNEAIEAFRSDYWRSANHKAFAASEDGAWGWSGGQTRAQRVRDLAWQSCQGHVQASGGPCRIVNIDGAWQSQFKLQTFEDIDPSRQMSELSGREKALYCEWALQLTKAVFPGSEACGADLNALKSPIVSCSAAAKAVSSCTATVGQIRARTRSMFEVVAKHWCELLRGEPEACASDLFQLPTCEKVIETCMSLPVGVACHSPRSADPAKAEQQREPTRKRTRAAHAERSQVRDAP